MPGLPPCWRDGPEPGVDFLSGSRFGGSTMSGKGIGIAVLALLVGLGAAAVAGRRQGGPVLDGRWLNSRPPPGPRPLGGGAGPPWG